MILLTLKHLANTMAIEDINIYNSERGKLLGIPTTAINGFNSKNTITSSNLPPDAIAEFKYANFIPSNDHWQEELEIIKKSNAAVRKIAPELFT